MSKYIGAQADEVFLGNVPMKQGVPDYLIVRALPTADVRCCFNCTRWHKKHYIHCQCSGPWGGDIFGDKNCTFKAKKVRSNAEVTSRPSTGDL